MRIGISATYASSEASFRNAGISRYIRMLVDELVRRPEDDAIEAFTTTAFEPPASWSSPRLAVRPVAPAGRISRTLWDLRADTGGHDVWFTTGHVAPLSRKVPRLAMIHDLIPLRHPEYGGTAQAAFLRVQLRLTCRVAERLITNSQATKRDIVELAGIEPERIVVAPLGPGNAITPIDPARIDRAKLAALGVPEGPFLFSLCTLEPRKNLDRLVEALAIVRRELGLGDLKLVVGGARGWKEGAVFERLRALGLENAVTFLGYVPDEALAGIFALCAAFVYPSLIEGFGMPVLEAMMAGAPVLTSAGGAMEEVAGDAAAGYFDPTSTEAIAATIAAFFGSSTPRAKWTALSQARAAESTWRRTAAITRAAMAEIAL